MTDSYLNDSKVETTQPLNTSNSVLKPKAKRATHKRSTKKVDEVLKIRDEVINVDPKFKQEVENGRLHVDLIKNDRRYKINYETVNDNELIRVALKVNKEETAVGYFKRVVNDTNVSYEYVH